MHHWDVACLKTRPETPDHRQEPSGIAIIGVLRLPETPHVPHGKKLWIRGKGVFPNASGE